MAELNVRPGTLFVRDNLEVLRGINDECVDLVYLDPPFHSDRMYVAPLNSEAAGQEFDDVWHPSDLKREWFESIKEVHEGVYAICEAARVVVGPERWAYLIFMAVRLLEIHRVLKPTGSCWLHCDWHADGWLRALMDATFGAKQVRCSIVWCYTGPGSPKMRQFNRKHDTLLWYAKGKTWTFNKDEVRIAYKPGIVGKLTKTDDNVWGALSREEAEAYAEKGKIPETWWTGFNASWYMSKSEKTGWKTQKPLALLERVVLACSSEGDVVLDPFCGCATTMVAAQKHHRGWIGIDRSKEAQHVTLLRMMRETDLLDARLPLHVEFAVPERTDGGVHACEALALELTLKQQRAMVLTGPQKRDLRWQLYHELEGKCQGLRYADGSHVPCLHGGPFMPIEFFQLDHVRPRSQGGKDTAANLQLGCSSCNGFKAAHLEPPTKRRKGK